MAGRWAAGPGGNVWAYGSTPLLAIRAAMLTRRLPWTHATLEAGPSLGREHGGRYAVMNGTHRAKNLDVWIPGDWRPNPKRSAKAKRSKRRNPRKNATPKRSPLLRDFLPPSMTWETAPLEVKRETARKWRLATDAHSAWLKTPAGQVYMDRMEVREEARHRRAWHRGGRDNPGPKKPKKPKPDPRQLGLRLPSEPGRIDRMELLETADARQLTLPVRKNARRKKAPELVDLEFVTPAEFRWFKVQAVNYPEKYGHDTPNGWQLPDGDRSRFYDSIRAARGKVTPIGKNPKRRKGSKRRKAKSRIAKGAPYKPGTGEAGYYYRAPATRPSFKSGIPNPRRIWGEDPDPKVTALLRGWHVGWDDELSASAATRGGRPGRLYALTQDDHEPDSLDAPTDLGIYRYDAEEGWIWIETEPSDYPTLAQAVAAALADQAAHKKNPSRKRKGRR